MAGSPQAPYRLDGRAAIVTGSSAGLGEAIARELAALGASVVINAREGERAESVAASIRATGMRAVAHAADVTVEADVRALVDAALDAFGHLDVLVNNAGRGNITPTEELSLADWDAVLRVNLTAPFLCSRAAVAHLAASGDGVIVNIGSILSSLGIAQRAAYAASKHGLAGLTKVLAAEWAARGVRVVGVDPGYVHTELLAANMRRSGFTADDLARRTPLRRLARAEEIARVVGFACSGAASYITGTSLAVDGGWVSDGGWS
jgi:NAD(P)-dependent dehydrogenase (short-subunit alcohol dehydrogenase family)